MTQTLASTVLDRLQKLGHLNKASIPLARNGNNVVPGSENRNFYLSEGRKKKAKWFRCPKSSQQYSEFVTITPEMANELLETYTGRKSSGAVVAAYASDILHDRWISSAESIQIDEEGNLFDGQHRLLGIIEANKECDLYVTFNVACAARFVVDSGRKRNIKDKLALVLDGPITTKTTAVCRSMMRGVNSDRHFSEIEIAEFAMKYEDVISWTHHQLQGVRADIQAAIAKAALWYGKDAISPFCERFKSMAFQGSDDPACLLYKFIDRLNRKISGPVIYKKTINALELFLSNRKVKMLYEKEVDIFEWEPNWTVPKK